MSGFEAERVRALVVLHSLNSKKKLAAEKRHEIHFLRNEEKQKWIENHFKWETDGARKRVEHAVAAMRQEQEDTEATENMGLTTWESEKPFHEMMVVIGDSLSDIAISDYEEDRE